MKLSSLMIHYCIFYYIGIILVCNCKVYVYGDDSTCYHLDQYIFEVLQENQDLKQKSFTVEQTKAITFNKANSRPYKFGLSYNNKSSHQLSTYVQDSARAVLQNTNAFQTNVSKKYLTGTELKLSYGYDYVKNNSRQVLGNLQTTNSSNVNLSLSQPVLAELSNIVNQRDYKLAEIEESINTLDMYNVIISTVIKAVETYNELISIQYNLVLKTHALELVQKSKNTIEELVEKKFENREKLMQTQSKILEKENDLYSAQIEYQQKQAIFLQLINKVDDGNIIVLLTDPLIPQEISIDISIDEMVKKVSSRRYDCQQAEMKIKKSEINLKIVQSNTLPNLNITGGYAIYGTDSEFSNTFQKMFSLDYNTWSVGMNFSMPIDKGYRQNQMIPQQISLREAQYQKNNLEKSIRQELQTVYSRLALNYKQFIASENLLKIAEENEKEAKEMFESGFMPFDSFMETMKSREIAEVQKMKKKIEYTNAFYLLKKAKGELLECFEKK